MTGKDLTLSYVLSRIKVCKSKPHGIIYISFDLQDLLQETYCIHTRSAAQKAGITVGKVHGHNKPLLLTGKKE